MASTKWMASTNARGVWSDVLLGFCGAPAQLGAIHKRAGFDREFSRTAPICETTSSSFAPYNISLILNTTKSASGLVAFPLGSFVRQRRIPRTQRTGLHLAAPTQIRSSLSITLNVRYCPSTLSNLKAPFSTVFPLIVRNDVSPF